MAVTVLPEPMYKPSPDDYIHLRWQIEQDPNRWLAALPQAPSDDRSHAPNSMILRAGQRDGLLDQ